MQWLVKSGRALCVLPIGGTRFIFPNHPCSSYFHTAQKYNGSFWFPTTTDINRNDICLINGTALGRIVNSVSVISFFDTEVQEPLRLAASVDAVKIQTNVAKSM
jgi:hypothetical protein